MYQFESSAPMCEPASALDLRFYYCGTMECDHSRAWGPALRDHYRLHFIEDGRGQLLSGGRSWDLSAGDCYVISPGELAGYQPEPNTNWSYYWVAFDGLNAQSFLRRAGFSSEKPVRALGDMGTVVAIFQEMFAASQVKSSGDLRLLSGLYRLLAGLLDSAPADGQAAGGTKHLYAAKAVEWLEINYPRDISIADLVDFIGLNGKYFSRMFKAETGQSPQSFLINLRLNKACELMRNPAPSIGDIARSVGYPDQLLFSRMFRRFKGSSPAAWRRALGQR
jgi:AraC-like DNA-binding protein